MRSTTVLLIATDVHLEEAASARLTKAGFRVATTLNDDAKAEIEVARMPTLFLADLRSPRPDSLQRLKSLLPLETQRRRLFVVCASRRVASEAEDLNATIHLLKHDRDADFMDRLRTLPEAIERERDMQPRRDQAHLSHQPSSHQHTSLQPYLTFERTSAIRGKHA